MASYSRVKSAYEVCLEIDGDVIFPGLDITGDDFREKPLVGGVRFFDRTEWIRLKQAQNRFGGAVVAYTGSRTEGNPSVDQMVSEVGRHCSRMDALFGKVEEKYDRRPNKTPGTTEV